MSKIEKQDLHKIPFAERLQSLEEIYHTIQQSEDKDIEKIMELYENGFLLAKSLENDVNSYELKIQEIQHSCDDIREAKLPKQKRTKSIKKAQTKQKSLLFQEDGDTNSF